MKILAVNAGSSSLKFQMYEMPEERVLISGNFERIGIADSFYTIKLNGEKIKKSADLPTHKEAVKILAEELISNQIVSSLDEIKGIGHRVVQGADCFEKSVIASDEVVLKVDELSALAPLHNPAAVIGIKTFKEAIPSATPVVVFDTSFHQTMEKESYMYALPYEWYEELKVRKYGAHGTSHKYVAERAASILGRNDLKLITCHIGSGASISAVKDGKCVDTSMGFTPNAGLVMGTRCGDIDASIIPYVMNKLNLTPNDVDTYINKKSGLLGISGVSSDNRDIEAGLKEGNERCLLAQQLLERRIVDYIARYYVLLGGADAIIFTAGLGENAIDLRRDVLNRLKVLGVKVDEEANNIRGEERLITTNDSLIKAYIIPTDEEVMIARDTFSLVK